MTLDNRIVYKLLKNHNQTNQDKKEVFNLSSFISIIGDYAQDHPADVKLYNFEASKGPLHLATQKNSPKYNKYILEQLNKFGYLDVFSAKKNLQDVFLRVSSDDNFVNKLKPKQISQAFNLLQKLNKTIEFQLSLTANLKGLEQLTQTDYIIRDYGSSLNEFYKNSDLNKLKLPLKPLTFGEAEKLFKPNSEKLV